MADRDINENTLRGLIDVFWNAHELQSFHDYFADDAVLHSGTQDYAGTSGLRDGFAGSFMTSFPDLHHEIEILLVDGDWAAMRYHGTGALKRDYGGLVAKSQKLDYHGTAIFRMVDGRVAEVWGHSDLADWIAAQSV